jgi:hypothetical protein
MMPVLGNAGGLWALVGVPAILAIHFLQQRARLARTSTWFLIERLAPDSARGRTWDRLRTSRTLWLQLLAVLLATWILIEPRWVRSESAQTVVVVFDASASMEAFRSAAIAAAEHEMAQADGLASHTTWVVMTTNPRQPPLYRGTERAAAEGALASWHPELGEHDVGPALRLARGLAGIGGRTLLITDVRAKSPPDQRAVGVGRPIDNVGFAGSSVAHDEQGYFWRALIKNHATTAQHRTWYLEAAGQASPQQAVDLAPEALHEISARFPPGMDELTVVLSPDSFTADDRLPIVRPIAKPLSVSVDGDDDATEFFRRIARSVEGVTVATNVPTATLRLGRISAADLATERRGGIFWAPADRRQQIPLMTDPIVAERNALVAGLNWQGWIGTGPDGFSLEPGDVPLLWQDRWPLALLRPATSANSAPAKVPHGNQLLLAFDWGTSNAARLPAMVLLGERFLAQERDAQNAPYTQNFDCGAAVTIADAIPAGPLTLTFRAAAGGPAEVRIVSSAERSELRAPGRAGLFSVTRGDQKVVQGSAQFADARQGDFRNADTFVIDIPGERRAALERNTQDDPLATVWLVTLMAILLASWWTRRSSSLDAMSPAAATTPSVR